MKNWQLTIPHEYPFLFIDRVISLEEDRSIICEKAITQSEFYYSRSGSEKGYFPRVLLVEAMAQASGLLIMVTVEGSKKKMGYLSSLSNVVFHDDVSAGELITIVSEFSLKIMPHCAFRAYIKKEDKLIAEAELTLTVF